MKKLMWFLMAWSLSGIGCAQPGVPATQTETQAAQTDTPATEPDAPAAQTGVDTTRLQRAVELATAALTGQSHYKASEYTLISARQMLINGQFIWQVTFKPTNLLPEDPSTEVIGAGGEIFVNVDLKTGKAELRYGE